MTIRDFGENVFRFQKHLKCFLQEARFKCFSIIYFHFYKILILKTFSPTNVFDNSKSISKRTIKLCVFRSHHFVLALQLLVKRLSLTVLQEQFRLTPVPNQNHCFEESQWIKDFSCQSSCLKFSMVLQLIINLCHEKLCYYQG